MQQIKRRGQFEQGSLDNYGVPFVDPEDVLDARVYWEIYADVIHQVTDRKVRRGRLFSGAFGGPELSVRFAPLAVLPHANYVVWTPGISADDVRDLRRLVRRKLRGSRRIKPGLYPHVAAYRVLSSEDLKSVVKYIFKPIALADVYRLTADKLNCEPRGLKRLNDQVNIFLDNLEFAFHGLDRMNRYGFCSPSSGDENYIGKVTQERRTRRIVDATRRAKRKAEDRELKRRFPGYQPYKRKKTQKQRDEAVLRRAYLRRMVRDGEVPGK
jgi:hypothetical protein